MDAYACSTIIASSFSTKWSKNGVVFFPLIFDGYNDVAVARILSNPIKTIFGDDVALLLLFVDANERWFCFGWFFIWSY